jgi:hypothetical protein
LRCPLDRLLTAPAYSAQQPTDVVAVVAYAERAPHSRGNARGRPHVTTKAPRGCSTPQQGWNLRPLLPAQAGRETAGRAALEGVDPACAPAPEPLTDGAFADSHRHGDVLVLPTPLLQLPRALPPLCAPVSLRGCSSCTPASKGNTALLLSADISRMPLSAIGTWRYVSIQVRLCMTERVQKRITMADNWTAPGQARGALGLMQAFLNTRYGSGRRYHEELDTAERLRAWLTRHHLLNDDAPVTEGDLRRTLSVREALRAVLRANTPATIAEPLSVSAQQGAVSALLLGTARAPSRSVMSSHNPVADAREAADVLNAIATYAPLSVRFQRDGQTSLEPALDGVDGALARLLAAVPLAQADGRWRRLKICRNDSCGRAFFDTSKNHSGAWCDLGKCGNRLNAQASRARRRLGQAQQGLTTPPGLR